ncbi:MAG: prephenate dehydrogenase/arogenate dehydrogenase family protein [Saprospiraceae bacterium]|nr:prephenate dehydrogenase/arogenate dehydrogenase family protein [Saprospiraceae bacterium]
MVHQISTLDDGIQDADIILIAVPVDKIESLLPYILDKMKITNVAIDVGSTKEAICKSINSHLKNRFYCSSSLGRNRIFRTWKLL